MNFINITNPTKQFKNYIIKVLINLSAAEIFSILSLSFHADISIFAFIISMIYTGVTIFLSYKMIVKTDGKHIFKVIKFTEYLPYVLLICFILRRAGKTGTPYGYDVVTVILWFIVFVMSYFSSRCLYPKKNSEIIKGWQNPPVEKKLKGMSKVIFEVVDWIDALVWSIFTVLIFQIFVMQLYEIPSESMVPTFLIKDRVFVSKLDCGPKFPLTDVGLPDFRKYKRGDTIVLRNPHYAMDRKSEVKTVSSQLIYMLSLMTINLNRDEYGEQKADPLVKRITGLPGEQLVMQDGVLYVRTKENDVFTPSEIDKKYAAWNLNAVNPKLKNKIQYYPFDAAGYEKMLELEEERRNYDLNIAEYNAGELVRKLNALAYKDNLNNSFTTPDLNIEKLFVNAQQLTINLMTQEGGVQWFDTFMTSWIPEKDKIRDMYADSNYRLNVMTKLAAGRLIVRYAELLSSGVSTSTWKNDNELSECYEEAELLYWYIQGLLDERNMPVFPANDSYGNPQYIPNNCYFMMGDNRFNSLDLRHSSDRFKKALTDADSLSIEYLCQMSPQYINKKYIIGKPAFRFWPAGRMGKV